MNYTNIEERQKKKKAFVVLFASTIGVIILIAAAFFIAAPPGNTTIVDVKETGNEAVNNPPANIAQEQMVTTEIASTSDNSTSNVTDSLLIELKAKTEQINLLQKQLETAKNYEERKEERMASQPDLSNEINAMNKELAKLKRENDKLKIQLRDLRKFMQ